MRGDISNAPVQARYPDANDYQIYSTRATLLWKPLPNLTITPSFFFETSHQANPDSYDATSATNNSPGGGLAHYQVFDIAQPLTDDIKIYSLVVDYELPFVDITSSTSYWSRVSVQKEEASEAFNNPATGATNFANGVNASGQGYYGPDGSGPESGVERDPSHQFTQELRFSSRAPGRLSWVGGLFYSLFYSLWSFAGTTPNYTSFTDLGSLAPGFTPRPANTPDWFDVYEPTVLSNYAVYGDASSALTSKLKLEVGGRFNHSRYKFSSVISGWGSALGSASPSDTGRIDLSTDSFTPKFTLSYAVTPSLLGYATAAKGFRPGGGNALYPTVGPVWGAAYAKMGYTGGRFPTTYNPDSICYELGEKGRFFHNRLTLNASLYYEDWKHIQLEAYPDDFALNINGNHATIYGGEVDARVDLGAGFDVSVSGGYVHERLNGGPHWDIPPLDILPEVAPETGTAVLDYTRRLGDDLVFTAQVQNSYTGRRYSLAFPFPNNAYGQYVPMSAYDLTNLRASLKLRDSLTGSVFVNNVFNKHAQLESLYTENLASAAFNQIVTNQPLTAGIDLSYRY